MKKRVKGKNNNQRKMKKESKRKNNNQRKMKKSQRKNDNRKNYMHRKTITQIYIWVIVFLALCIRYLISLFDITYYDMSS
mgnify:CR=1 FL=1